MAAFLKYRFPGADVVTKSGEFLPLDSDSSINGFIVSDFEGHEILVFKENSKEEDLFFSKEVPHCITHDEYLESADLFLNEIRIKELGKAVFSRVKQLEFDSGKIFRLFDELEKKYPDTLVYLISSERFGTWIGATPEKLLEGKNGLFQTMSLAGTLPLSNGFIWTDKERDEQKQVTDFILNLLKSAGASIIEASGPKEVVAGAVKHLRTDISFSNDQSKAFELASALHPTPAVSGMPRKESIELIRKYEKHSRNLYAGMIGWVGAEECKLYVNLRCATIHSNLACLYLGGGFTKHSQIENEWNETENKSRTLLNLMEKL